MALLVVDGYACLDPDGRPGLGARAHAEFAVTVKGPATITVGPGVKAVQVGKCQPWYPLGDDLDAVIAVASEPGNSASRD
jgi:deoxyribonuclease V